MNLCLNRSVSTAVLLCLAIFVPVSQADEGMWLFDALPRDHLLEKHGFSPSEEWLEKVMHASVRFSSGGSAAFVSSSGLVLTNHHVAADTLHKLSTPEANYYDDGFLATSAVNELKAPDLELNQLISIEDVTDRVNQSVTGEMSPQTANRARQAAMEEIERESLEQTGLRSDVITLFGGAKYHLYRYKKYTDVRLVWAPESSAAFFGGDFDNFEYPRYCMDVALFRVYENGRPAEIEQFLKWSENGAEEGELVFVTGNPGRTDRSLTVAALEYLRDHRLPHWLNSLCRTEIALQQFGLASPEHHRRANDLLFSIQNRRKAVSGKLAGLQNPQLMQKKMRRESDLREKILQDSSLHHYDSAWDEIAEIQATKAALLGRAPMFHSTYFGIAEQLVLMATEDQKPSSDRLREYRDSNRESLEHELFSPAPIYDDLEIARLATELSMFVERRGGDDPLVVDMLAGKNPRSRAVELVNQSQLNRVELRRELADGGAQAIQQSRDPMIQFFLSLESEYRAFREKFEEIEEIERQAYARIDEAKIAVEGSSGYPDATFTLRLAFGEVKSYEQDGQQIPAWTKIGGAFRHQAEHESKDPWLLPDSWQSAEPRLNAEIPLNFVCTADITGGNSGSPVINRAGEFVGVIFDGNMHSLTGDYLYDDEVARAVSVHSSGIREVLRTVYNAEQLADELGE